MQSVQKVRDISSCDDNIRPINNAVEAEKGTMNVGVSPKATYRKFLAENRLQMGVTGKALSNLNANNKNEYMEIGDSIFSAKGISDVRIHDIDIKKGTCFLYINYGEIVGGGGARITCSSIDEAKMYIGEIVKHFEDHGNFNYIQLGEWGKPLIVNLNDVDGARIVPPYNNIIEVNVRVFNNCYPAQPYVWNLQAYYPTVETTQEAFKELKDAMKRVV